MTAPAADVDSTTQALENQFGLADRIIDEAALANSVERFREQGITLPTFAQLEDPSTFDHDAKVGDADHLVGKLTTHYHGTKEQTWKTSNAS